MGRNDVEKPRKKVQHLCHICNKYISGSSYCLKAHLYQHKQIEPRFKCPHCNKQYFRKDVYTKHFEKHTGERRVFICDYCERSFINKRNLISHLTVHEDDKYFTLNRFKCQACGIQYCEERLLKYHIRKMHFNLQQKDEAVTKKCLNETWIERVLETNVCVQITKINNNVITIKKCDSIKEEDNSKNDEKNNFVTYVNSVFGCNDKSHYSKAICDYCNKEMLKKSLHNHIRERHLNIRKFRCDICKRGFKRQYQMTDHICGKKMRRNYKE